MGKFIAQSPSSKKLLHIAQISSTLPVNILIVGEKGVGKKDLARNILSDASIFEATILEENLKNKTINLDEYKELILTGIEKIINKKEFLDKLKNIRIIATSVHLLKDIESNFAVKLDIPPLNEREEDLDELIKIFTKEVEEIYDIKINKKDIKIDLSANAISLKKSIFKYGILNSLKEQDMSYTLEHFISKKLEEESSYKKLLEYFEVPLLKATKKRYKSQLQMANKLKLNRITLRKKLELYAQLLNN